MTFFTRCSICRCLIEKDTYAFYCMCILVLMRFHFILCYTIITSQSNFDRISRNHFTRLFSFFFLSFLCLSLALFFSDSLYFLFFFLYSFFFWYITRIHPYSMCFYRYFTFYFPYVCDMNLKIGNEIGVFWWIFCNSLQNRNWIVIIMVRGKLYIYCIHTRIHKHCACVYAISSW